MCVSIDAVIGNNQRLSHVQVQVITNAVCAQTYGSNAIIASTLCTSGAGGRGVCPGDSGGPLVANNQLVSASRFSLSPTYTCLIRTILSL